MSRVFWAVPIFIVMYSGIIYGQEATTVPDASKLQKYIFSRQNVEYFSDGLGSCLMKLQPDGRYQSMSYSNKDEGTWQQLPDGNIRLSSETEYNCIYTDEFSVGICSKEVLDQIPAMRERIAGLLTGNTRESFSIQEIEDASKCSCDGNKTAIVSAFTTQQEFPRSDLVDLITAIDVYLMNDDKSVSYLIVYQYPQYGFFEDDFSSYEIPYRLVEDIEKNNIEIPAGDGYIGRLNNLIKVRGLSSHFSNIKLSDKDTALLARETELSQPDLIRLNRLILEAAFPDDCPRSIPDRKVLFLFNETDEFEDLDDVLTKIDTGFAPQFALRKVDKDRYDESIQKEEKDTLAFDKMDQQQQRDLAEQHSLPPAEVSIYIFPQGQPQYFANSNTHTSYLVFQPDGRYRETLSSHFDVREYDSGIWKQSSDGRIKMVSEKMFHRIESGSLSIYISDKEDIECLKVLKKMIAGFINSHDEQSFSRTEIRDLNKDQTKRCGLLTVDLAYKAKTTSRNNLQKLLDKIDPYIQDSEKNIFYFTPYVYRDTTFLLDADQNQDAEYVEYVKESIDRKEWPFVYKWIDAKEFEEGSSSPQPFYYYPEMNDVIEQMQEE